MIITKHKQEVLLVVNIIDQMCVIAYCVRLGWFLCNSSLSK